MRIQIKHPSFKTQRLSVETASLFSGPKLFLNDTELNRQSRRYVVASDSGQELPVKTLYNFLDPIPKVKIGDGTFDLAKPVRWYEYVWIGIPMLLVFAGGALGGLVGAGSRVVNGRIFRSERSVVSKYALAAVTTVVGAALFFVIAVAIQIAIGPKK